MAERPKILFQRQLTTLEIGTQTAPAANVGPKSADTGTPDIVAYTVPATIAAIVSSILIVNRNAAPTTFWLAVVPSGAGFSDLYYAWYAIPVPANETLVFTIGLTLAAGDNVRFFAPATNVAVHGYGEEMDV